MENLWAEKQPEVQQGWEIPVFHPTTLERSNYPRNLVDTPERPGFMNRVNLAI